ncbi:hypothetical protein [Brachybacterium aquaticum]|uniref:Uncharacterized protein n=1 Tax=Brachybacterium aquaticum TaxID=1432564 RepID=A0A841AHN2_9MICO|nr:hypothetical protein [Brachybacterium aquaticum]MBB5832772.1 hypothetical protein [Brachybacterium aquaticum]
MSTLSMLVWLLAGLCLFGTLISIHTTVVTARNTHFPRWVLVLAAVTLGLVMVAVLTMLV